MAKFFTGPTWTNNKPADGPAGHLFEHMTYLQVGYGIVRDQFGAFTQVTDSDDDLIKLSTAFYAGGRTYTISDSQAADLTAAGYGTYITTT